MSDSGRRASISHLPALDGLRGLAVIGVLLFHDNKLIGGYLGVDLFFVLSGFLITSLLLAEWKGTERIDLKAFWIRRARRLFPALLALLVGVAAFARTFAETSERGKIRADGLWTLGYLANWHSIFSGKSYWELFRSPSPLEHTWSLAIEEQFYVLWPLLVALVLRLTKGSSKVLLSICLGLLSLSGAAMWLMYSPETTSRIYMGTDTRGGSILAGAALACLLQWKGTLREGLALKALDLIGLFSFIGLSVAWLSLDGQSQFLYQGGFLVCELAVLVLIACAAHGKSSLMSRALSFAPIAKAGLISYGLYLWHWPIYVTLTETRLGFGGLRLTALRLVVTLLVSLVSFRYLEQPIRKRGLRWGNPLLVVPSCAATVIALLWISTRGASANVPVGPTAAQLALAAAPAEEPQGAIRILVEGDSVAMALGERLSFVGKGTRASVIVRGIGDCSLLEEVVPAKSLNNDVHEGGNCAARWANDAEELKPQITFVVLGGGFFARAKPSTKWERACDNGWKRAYAKELRSKLEGLRQYGGSVYVALAPYPVGIWVKANPHKLVDCYDDMMEEVVRGLAGYRTIDLRAELCPDGECEMTSQGAPIRPDGVHFDGLGAEDIARWTLKKLVEGEPTLEL
jgi:peptidoglycan/LPS O-acetylase OafA/YrhL